MQKKVAILFLLVFITAQLYSQSDSTNRFYFGIYGGLGSTKNIHLDVNHISSNDYTINLFYLLQFENSEFAPHDYRPEGIITLGYVPLTTIHSFGFSYGKMVNLNIKAIKFTLQGGLLFGWMKTPYNFKPRSVGAWLDFGSNYTYEKKEEIVFGLIINPKINFIFTRVVGMSLGVCANINFVKPTIAGELGINIGKLKKNKAK